MCENEVSFQAKIAMTFTFKKILPKLFLTIGILVSFNVFSCTSDEISQNENLSEHQASLLNLHQFDADSKVLSSHHHAKSAKKINSKNTDLLPHQDCECCEFCRCTSCSGCSSVGGSVLFPDSDNQNIESNVTSRVVLLEPSYISFLTSPPEHPPK